MQRKLSRQARLATVRAARRQSTNADPASKKGTQDPVNYTAGRVMAMLVLVAVVILLVIFLASSQDNRIQDAYPLAVSAYPDADDIIGWRNLSESAIEGFKYWSLQQTAETYEWQEYSTKVLFWLSILISICGICFSLWQFLEAGETERRSAHADELEVKNEYISLAFKSRSLASLMLFVSLAYLVIYSTLIYPIEAGPDEALKALADLSAPGTAATPDLPEAVAEDLPEGMTSLPPPSADTSTEQEEPGLP